MTIMAVIELHLTSRPDLWGKVHVFKCVFFIGEGTEGKRREGEGDWMEGREGTEGDC